VKTVVHQPRYRITIEREHQPRLELISSEERLVLGSSTQADIVIDDPTVSGIHWPKTTYSVVLFIPY